MKEVGLTLVFKLGQELDVSASEEATTTVGSRSGVEWPEPSEDDVDCSAVVGDDGSLMIATLSVEFLRASSGFFKLRAHLYS